MGKPGLSVTQPYRSISSGGGMAPMRPEGLCQTIPRSRWCWCLGLRRGQGSRRAWPQARGPLNRGALLVPQGKPAMPGWACTQLGMEDGGGVGAGSPEQWLDCSHQGTDLPGAGPSHQKERHINRKPQAGENCVQMGKIMSFHLIQLPWPDPCPAPGPGRAPSHPESLGKLWSFLQTQVSF